ncbi:MAG: holo-[acyl-carrier protein] synthase [Thermomicrobiales bacterium]|jgi:holo-[acyl-carrier protein] synthase|nr:holo-[acyl-carrier protein] synthase [Thermomicrobiales bacterium]
MMLSCGVDVVELIHFSRILERGGEHFLKRVFTDQELSYCRARVPQLAARFAAKEACTKALGTGARGVTLREIEVISDQRGKPSFRLSGRAAARAAEIEATKWSLSLSHSEGMAVAFVVMTGGRLADEVSKDHSDEIITGDA